MKQQFDENQSFFLNLSEDRLLKIYRQRAGLPAPGKDMGGWYDDFCPGAHFGQYVSALARFAAVTGSEPTRAKVKRLVRGYAQTIDDTGRNLYVPSRLTWTMNSVRCVLHQQTAYPTDYLMTMRLELSSPIEFSMYLRIPAWAGRGTSVSVNGAQACAFAGRFLRIAAKLEKRRHS